MEEGVVDGEAHPSSYKSFDCAINKLHAWVNADSPKNAIADDTSSDEFVDDGIVVDIMAADSSVPLWT